MRHWFACAVIGVLASFFADSSDAGVIKTLEFSVDGVLPSAEPDISLYDSTGQPESSLYSVSGGFLRQRTFPGGGEVVGAASYLFPNATLSGGGLSSALSTVLETRVNVLDVTSSDGQASGVHFQAYDGANRYTAFLTSTGVTVIASSGFVAVPFDVFGLHTYRIESAANSSDANLFVDGSLLHTWTAASHTNNGFGFGDGISAAGNSGNADWDFVRLSQDVELTAVPEPSSLVLLGVGAICLLCYGRRKRNERRLDGENTSHS